MPTVRNGCYSFDGACLNNHTYIVNISFVKFAMYVEVDQLLQNLDILLYQIQVCEKDPGCQARCQAQNCQEAFSLVLNLLVLYHDADHFQYQKPLFVTVYAAAMDCDVNLLPEVLLIDARIQLLYVKTGDNPGVIAIGIQDNFFCCPEEFITGFNDAAARCLHWMEHTAQPRTRLLNP